MYGGTCTYYNDDFRRLRPPIDTYMYPGSIDSLPFYASIQVGLSPRLSLKHLLRTEIDKRRCYVNLS
jgi:hypothetical protein